MADKQPKWLPRNEDMLPYGQRPSGRTPAIPGRGDPPARSSVLGGLTPSQVAYYGGVKNAARAAGVIISSPRMFHSEWDGKSLSGLRSFNGELVAGLTTESIRKQIAATMTQTEVEAYNTWATLYPMNDPRTWLGLHLAGIDPMSEEAKATMMADLITQQEDLTYDGISTPKQVLPDRAMQARMAADAATQRAQGVGLQAMRPGDDVLQALSENSPQSRMEQEQSLGGRIWDSTVGAALSGAQSTVRNFIPAAMFGYDMEQAFGRTALGGQKKINDFLERAGYNSTDDWRQRWYFIYGTQPPSEYDPVVAAFRDTEGIPRLDEIKAPWAMPPSAEPLTTAEMQRLDDLREEFQDDPDNFNADVGDERGDVGEWADEAVPSMFRQTVFGQQVTRPDLANDPSLGGTGWLPNVRLFEEADKESGRAYDVRSVAEQDKDVAVAAEVLADARRTAERAGQLASNPRLTSLDDFIASRDLVDPAEKEYLRTGIMPQRTVGGELSTGLGGDELSTLTVDAIPAERIDYLDALRDQYEKSQKVSEAAVTAYQVVYGAPEDYAPEDQKRAKQFLDEYAGASKEVQSAILASAFDQVVKITAPVGWTPGRGVAAAWGLDVDSTAAATFSGLIDMAGNIAFDPVNLVPLAKGGSLASKALSHIPGTLTHALQAGDNAIARIPNPLFRAADAVPMRPVGHVVRASALDKDLIRLAREAGVQSVKNPSKAPGKNILVNSRAWDWLGHGRGQRVVQYIAGEADPIKIWLASNRKIDLTLARTLSYANDEATVRAALATRMGYEIDRAAQFGSMGARVPPMLYKVKGVGALAGSPSKNSWTRRQFQLAPREEVIDLSDVDTTLNELYRWGTGVGMTPEQMSPALNKVLFASGGSGLYDAIVDEFFSVAAEHLGSKWGMTHEDALKLTRLFKENDERSISTYANAAVSDSIGHNGGKGSSLLMSEQLQEHIFLPSYREARRAAGIIGNIRAAANKAGVKGITRSGYRAEPKETSLGKFFGSNPELDWESNILNAMQRATSYWKYSVLLRPAYVMREIGEMTFAASLAGYKSGLFTHPIALIGAAYEAALAKSAQTVAGRAMRALASGGGSARDLRDAYATANAMRTLAPHMDPVMARINGDKMWEALDEFGRTGHSTPLIDALSTVHVNLNVMDEPLSRQVGRHLSAVTVKQHDEYADVLVNYLVKLHADADVRNLMNPEMTFRQVMKAFRDGTRKQRIASQKTLDGTAAGDRKFVRDLELTARAYTADDPVITAAILTGKYNDELIEDSKAFRTYISERLADPEFERALPAALGFWAPARQGHRTMQEFDGLAQRFFETVGEFSDIFARAPLLREAYADKVVELMPHMTREARAAAVKNLREAGDHKLARRVQDTNFVPGGTLTIESVEAIAEGFALREAQRVFYNAYRRQNYAQALRVVMPFAQATFNTFRRWGELSLANPQMAYRSMKPLNALQQPGSAVLYDVLGAITHDDQMQGYYTPGRPDLSVNGYFFTDPTSGERVFAYPLLGPLARAMPFLGAPVPGGSGFLSNMDGLNVAGQSASPGAGPFLVLAASMVTGDMIYGDDAPGEALRFMYPFGLPEGSPVSKILEAFSPTVIRHLTRAIGDEDERANLTVQTMGTLFASGGYDLANRGDMRRLTSDASSIAQGLTWFQALASASTPSTVRPIQSLAIADPSGITHFMLMAHMADELQKYTKKDYYAGIQAYVEDYGHAALLGTYPVTDANGAPQPTNSVWQFRTDNPEAYDKYQNVVGLVFPGLNPMESIAEVGHGPNDYSRALRDWQAAKGERITRLATAEQSQNIADKSPMAAFAREALKRAAQALWNSGSQRIASAGLSRDQQDAARLALKDDLMARYAMIGWSPKEGEGSDLKPRFDALREAFNDPEYGDEFMAQQGAPYVKEYLDARDRMLENMKGVTDSDSFATKEAAPWRDQLIDLGVKLMAADGTGTFVNAWNRLFSQELGDEENW